MTHVKYGSYKFIKFIIYQKYNIFYIITISSFNIYYLNYLYKKFFALTSYCNYLYCSHNVFFVGRV